MEQEWGIEKEEEQEHEKGKSRRAGVAAGTERRKSRITGERNSKIRREAGPRAEVGAGAGIGKRGRAGAGGRSKAERISEVGSGGKAGKEEDLKKGE